MTADLRLVACVAGVKRYMMEMCEARRASEKKQERHDLFSSLLDASDEEADGTAKLTDRELLGGF